MKKIISTIIALVLIASTVCLGAVTSSAADKELVFSLTNGAGMQNDYVTIDMNIDANPGFWAFEFGLFYNSDALILREVKINDEFKPDVEFCDFDETTMNNQRSQYDDDLENGVVPLSRIYRDAPKFGVDVESSYMTVIECESKDITEDNMYKGNILSLTFEVVGSAENGNYDVTLVPDVASIINTSDTDDEVPYKWSNSIISIGKDEPEPKDTEVIGPDDTIKVETKDSEKANTDDIIVQNDEPYSIAVETFVGDDGINYYIDNNGEKKEVPEDAEIDENGNLIIEIEPGVYDETGDIVPGEEEKAASKSIGDRIKNLIKAPFVFLKNHPLIIVFLIVAFLLIVAAILLVIFITKTKKNAKKLERENSQNNIPPYNGNNNQ